MSTQKYVVPTIGATKMSNEIIVLQSQIATIGEEIAALKEQAAKLKADISTPQYAGDPKLFGREVKAASQTLTMHQPQVSMLEDAITNLQNQLPSKIAALAELKNQQTRQARLERLEVGRTRLRAKISEVNSMAADIGRFYLEFKALHSQFLSDYQTEHYTPGSYVLWDSLVRFGNLFLPQLTEEHGQFILTSVQFDIFLAEKQAQQAAEAKKWAELHKSTEAAAQLQRNQREQLEVKIKRETLENLLRVKQEELTSHQAQRAKWLSYGGSPNFDKVDGVIRSLQVEINSIQAELDALSEG